MNKIFALLVVISFIIGNTYKFSYFSPDIKISLLDLTVITIFFYSLPRIYKHVPKDLLLFFVWSIFSLVLSYFHFGLTPLLIGSLYLWRWFLYSVLFLSFRHLFSRIQIKKLIYLLIITLVLVCAVQYIFFPDVRSLAVLEWDPHFYRVVGTLLDPGFTGLFLLFSFFFVYLYPLKTKIFQIVLIILVYVLFALTYSRTSFLAFIGGSFILSQYRKSPKIFFGLTTLLIATLFILPRAPSGEGVKLERTNSILARINNWKTGWAVFTRYPITGVGLNTYRYAKKQLGLNDNSDWQINHAGAGVDSSFLFVLATTGIVGFILYLKFLKQVYYFPRSPLLVITLFVLLIHTQFLNSLFYPFVLVWLSLVRVFSIDDTPPSNFS